MDLERLNRADISAHVLAQIATSRMYKHVMLRSTNTYDDIHHREDQTMNQMNHKHGHGLGSGSKGRVKVRVSKV